MLMPLLASTGQRTRRTRLRRRDHGRQYAWVAKLFLLALGSRGDVQPFAALAMGLRDAGHEVVLATPSGFQDLVSGGHLTHVEVSPSLTPADVMAARHPAYDTPDFDLDALTKQHPVRVRRQLMTGWMDLMDGVMATITEASAGADLVAWWEPTGNIGRHLAQSLEVPGVAAGLNPENWMSSTIPVPPPTLPWPPLWLPPSWRAEYIRFGHVVFWQWTASWYRARVNQWRTDVLGLPALPHRGWVAERVGAPALRLSAVSPLVRDLPPEWRGTVVPTGYWILPAVDEWTMPHALRTFLDGGPPPIFASMGTAVSFPPRLGRMVIEAARRSGVRLVLGTGWDGRGGIEADALPPGVIAVGDVPHERVFPLMSGIVHHGGGGSVAAALRAGIPSMALPVFADQTYWGRQIAALGVGPDPHPAKKVTLDQLTVAMCQMVNDEPMKRRAAELGAQLHLEDGVASGVAALDGLLSKTPLRRPSASKHS
jgi:sterol 3beta-glucosyltransferase